MVSGPHIHRNSYSGWQVQDIVIDQADIHPHSVSLVDAKGSLSKTSAENADSRASIISEPGYADSLSHMRRS